MTLKLVAAIGMLVGLGACAASNGGGWGDNDGYYQSGYPYQGGYYYQPAPTYYAGSSYVFYPQPGIRCDRYRGYCYDRYGVDRYYTDRYFDDDGPSLGDIYDNDDNDDDYVIPREGITCNDRTHSCSDARGVDAYWTGQVYGDRYEERVEDWREAKAFSPANGVVCNRSRRTCGTQYGPDVRLTQIYFGKAAALDLSDRLHGNALPTPGVGQDTRQGSNQGQSNQRQSIVNQQRQALDFQQRQAKPGKSKPRSGQQFVKPNVKANCRSVKNATC